MNCLRPHAPPSLPRPLLGRLVLFGGTSTSTSTSTSVNTGVGRGGALCTPAAAAAAAAATLGVRHISKKAKEKAKKLEAAQKCAPPPGHGERFWVFNHIEANYVVYSMTPEMRKNKVFRQFPFTGKKLVPSKLRKDYWRKMAVVEFGEGKGEIGRSVFQKLLELKKRHALEWDDERLLRMPKRERGRELNDQRGNAVADLAAVLAGRGKGNKMVVCKRWPLLGEQQQQQQQQQQKGQDGQEVAKEGEGKQEAPRPKLQTATIYWANEQDKFYAESWTDNVTHVVGLPENTGKDEQPAEAEPAETEPAKESGGEAAAAQAT